MRSSDRASGWASAPIERITSRAFRIPTDAPEADGTLWWDGRATSHVAEIVAARIGAAHAR